MVYWIWFLANGLISLFFTIRMWPARVYAEEGQLADFGVIFGFLPGWFILTFSTFAALVLMYVKGRRTRALLYLALFAGSYAVAMMLQHTITAPIGGLAYSVISLGIFLVSRSIYKQSEYYDPGR